MRVLIPFVAFAGAVIAADAARLHPGEKVTGAEASSFIVSLGRGDLATVAIEGADLADVVLRAPNGDRIRKIGGPFAAKRTIVFAGVETGDYRLDLNPRAGSAAPGFTIMLEGLTAWVDRFAPEPLFEKYKSPRMEALRKEVAAGHADLPAFWSAVAKEGTPLVEPAEKDENNFLVTFLWRGDRETRNVMMWWALTRANPSDHTMIHIEGTDVWFRTLHVRRGARFTYQLSLNDPLVFDGPRGAQRQATLQADPLNPHRWSCAPDGTRFECQSRVELPGARPQPYADVRPGVPTGVTEKHSFKSEILKNERNITIYTPPGYSKTAAPYALLVVFDESAYLRLVPTPTTLDNLLAEKKIPPMIAVLIANPSQETRGKELPPNPDFADFLAKELIPWARGKYNITSDPKQTVVAGSSYGGIASTYAGLRHPEVFGNVLCQSGSFWWSPDRGFGGAAPHFEAVEPNWLAKQFIASPKLPLKFFMDAGSFEVDTSGSGGAILEPSRHMRDVLLAKGYSVTYQENAGGHDYLSWRGSLADGLIALIGLN